MNITIIVHESGFGSKEIKVPESTKLLEIIQESSIIEKENVHIFVGDCKEFPDESGNFSEDKSEVTDKSKTVGELKLDERLHLHICKCRIINVNIQFSGMSEHIQVLPSTTIDFLTKWAREHKSFAIDPTLAHQYDLRHKIGSGWKQPAGDSHVGDLVNKSNCEVELDLTKTFIPNA